MATKRSLMGLDSQSCEMAPVRSCLKSDTCRADLRFASTWLWAAHSVGNSNGSNTNSTTYANRRGPRKQAGIHTETARLYDPHLNRYGAAAEHDSRLGWCRKVMSLSNATALASTVAAQHHLGQEIKLAVKARNLLVVSGQTYIEIAAVAGDPFRFAIWEHTKSRGRR